MNSKNKQYHLKLYTIGHSNHTLEKFIELLRLYHITCIVDVRSIPYSKFNPQFSKEYLEKHLFSEHGIEYYWKGDKLGGRKQNLQNSVGMRLDTQYDTDPEYHSGVVELMRIALKKNTAIMCSEENPRKCHRHKIIAETILNKRIPECHKLDDIKILHIRADGKFEYADQVKIVIQTSLSF